VVDRRSVLVGGLLGSAAAACGAVWALSHRGRGPADAPAELRIATGPAGAVFRELGAALAAVLADRFPDTRVRAIPTGASVDNLALLASGGTDLALASLDATVAGLAAGRPGDVTAVARLYDSWEQVFVLASSPFHALTDLAGRRVAAGAEGSGTRFTTTRLLQVAGITADLVTATQDVGAAALAAGRVDALFTLTGVPTPAVTQLARTTPIRMISLEEYVDAMDRRFGELYAPATLSSSAYPGVAAAATITTPNLLLARPDLPDDVVEVITAALYEERARIAQGHPEANRINLLTGIGTGQVRLHPGAVRYLRSVKP
jgi:TRAP transporter TAXI family solute receptor